MFNIFQIIEIDHLDPDAAKMLVRRPWDGPYEGSRPTLVIDDDATDTIVEESAGHPWVLQMLCSSIVDYVNRIRTNVVRAETVIQAINDQVPARGGTIDYIWHGASPSGQLVLVALLDSVAEMLRDELVQVAAGILRTRGHEALVDVFLAQVGDGIRQLVVMGALRQGPSGYAFRVPLFRRVLELWGSRSDLERTAMNGLLNAHRS